MDLVHINTSIFDPFKKNGFNKNLYIRSFKICWVGSMEFANLISVNQIHTIFALIASIIVEVYEGANRSKN